MKTSTIKTLTVYLGSSGHVRPIFREAAQGMADVIAHNNLHLVYGGMDAGMMGLLAAHALAGGARVTGIVPQKLKDSERILKGLSETILVNDLWDRKKRMFLMADAIIALPGGFGTLDESLEVLYWGYLRLHDRPLVLVNVDGYWNDMIAYLQTLPDFNPGLLIVAQSPEEVMPLLAAWTAPYDAPPMPDHLPHFEDEITRDTQEPIIIDAPSVQNSYYAACALGLKQLGRHHRKIGFINAPGADGQGSFSPLLAWFQRAAMETFITPSCLQLFDSAPTRDALLVRLDSQPDVHIDLHGDKWGAPVFPVIQAK